MRWTLDRLFTRSEPVLRSGRVLLVVPTASHYEAWSSLRGCSRQHLEPFEPAWADDELSAVAFRRRLKRYRADRRRGVGASYLILRDCDRMLVGGVTLTNIRRGVTQSVAVGYWIGLPFVRNGYASDAVRATLGYAFDALGLNRVEAACMPSNRASIGVLERAGFKPEGLARRYLMINGKFEDHLLFARLRGDPAPSGLAATGAVGSPVPVRHAGGDAGTLSGAGPPRIAAEGHAA